MASQNPASPVGSPIADRAGLSGAERRRHPRIRVDDTEVLAGSVDDDRRQGDRRQGDRRQGERRGVQDLRSSMSWTVSADKGRGARGAGGRWRLLMKSSRMLVLLVALGAGGIAAWLAINLTSQRGQPVEAAGPEVAPEPSPRVLVASKGIRIGERLSSASLAWQDWPKQGLGPDYVTLAAAPAAIAEMSGAVARAEFLPGDPIRKQKLAQSADSLLPALLDGGMRGVSVAVTPESASGGFISPNDRVDVVLTRTLAQAENRAASSRAETILHNVQVLAIDSRVGPSSPSTESQNSGRVQPDTFNVPVIATLALDPADAEVIINAATVGKLSLLLRSAADLPDRGKKDGVNQSIRISSPFWSK